MQIAALTSILALAASASATPIFGTLNMWYDATSACTTDTLVYPQGKSLAVGSTDSCEKVDGAEFQMFEAIPQSPLFGFQLFSDDACTKLVTDVSRVCVVDVKSYKVVRL